MSNITIKITADTADLAAKFAVAKAESSAFTGELNKLAKQAATTGLNDTLKVQLDAAASAMLQGKANAAALGGELQHAAGHIAAVRELNMAFRELAEGNLSRLPVTMALLGHTMEGLGVGGALGLAGVTALVGGLAYLAYQSIQSRQELDRMSLAASFNGIDMPPAKLDALATSIANAGNISKSSALTIEDAMLKVKGATGDSMEASSRVVQAFAQLTEQTTDEATKQLAQMFSDPLTNVRSFVQGMGGATTAEILAADTAAKSGDRYRALSVMLETLANAEDRHKQKLVEENSQVLANTGNFLRHGLALNAVAEGGGALDTETRNIIGTQQVHTNIIRENTEAWNANAAAVHGAILRLQEYAATPQQRIGLGLDAGDAEDPLNARLETTQHHIAQIKQALKDLKADFALNATAADKIDIKKLDSQLAIAEDHATAIKSQIATTDPGLKTFLATEEAKSAAAKAGSAIRIANAEHEAAAIKAALEKQGVDPSKDTTYLAAVQKINQERQAAAAAGAKVANQTERDAAQVAISTARDASQEILSNERLNADERLSLTKQIWTTLLSGDKLNAEQRAALAKGLAEKIASEEHLGAEDRARVEQQISALLVASGRLTAQSRSEAVRDEASSESEARKKAAQESVQADREAVQMRLAAIRSELDVYTSTLDEEVSYGQITAAEKGELSRAAAEKAIQDQIDVVTSARANWAQGTKDYVAYTKQLADLSNQLKQTQIRDAAEAAQAAKQDWQGILSPIESGTNSMLSGLLQRTQSFAQTTRQVLLQVVADFLSARIKIEFDWLAGQAAMAFGAQSWAHKSFLSWIASIFGIETAQDASTAKQVSTVAAGEAAKTGAVAAGATAQTAIKTGAAAVGNAAEAAADSTSIFNSAYTAGASAFKWVMQEVPFPLNVVLAPVAAAAAFTGVMAFNVIKSAAGGQYRVPVDEQLTLAHKDESIMAASEAVPMRTFFSDDRVRAAIAALGTSGGSAFSGGGGKKFDGSLAGGMLASLGDLGARPVDLSGGVGASAFANVIQRVTAPANLEQIVAAALNVHAQATAPSSGARRAGDTYNLNVKALDASDFEAFLRKAANRRALERHAIEASGNPPRKH